MSAPGDFWQFSLEYYARPGVEAACLALQDEAGADVDLLLYLLFCARHGRALSGEEVARLDRLVADWRAEVVRPLRAIRRRLKTGFPDIAAEALRSEVKRLELEAERLQQQQMETAAPPASLGAASAPAPAARANLERYAAYLGGLAAGPVGALLAAF
jgi:uncharacterized protein (TIGR02444 family)